MQLVATGDDPTGAIVAPEAVFLDASSE